MDNSKNSTRVGVKRKGNPNQDSQYDSNKRNGGRHGGSGGSRGNSRGGNRHYYCKRCGQDHPGKDCRGHKVECRNCGKFGHRAYECFKRIEMPNNQGERLTGKQAQSFGSGYQGRGSSKTGQSGAGTGNQQHQWGYRGGQTQKSSKFSQGGFNKADNQDGTTQNSGRLSAISDQEGRENELIAG